MQSSYQMPCLHWRKMNHSEHSSSLTVLPCIAILCVDCATVCVCVFLFVVVVVVYNSN